MRSLSIAISLSVVQSLDVRRHRIAIRRNSAIRCRVTRSRTLFTEGLHRRVRPVLLRISVMKKAVEASGVATVLAPKTGNHMATH